jgi:hypothetical protein
METGLIREMPDQMCNIYKAWHKNNNSVMMNKGLIAVLVIAVAAIAVGVLAFTGNSVNTDGKYDEFAQCLTTSGTKMYGAYWCPHCSDQKEAFGSSWQYVNYVECSNPDGSQTDVCVQAGIRSYPTWEFPDGSRQSGFLSFETLASKTGCELPG